MVRGINRQRIFAEEKDNTKFIEILRKYKKICEYDLYAYCLMGNHAHLLVKENKEPIGIFMRKICSSYALWYNKKHNRVGHLFQGRFKSEPVEDDTYFLVVLRYILQNPVKANLVTKIRDYKWSNFKDYINGNNNMCVDFVLSLFHQDKEKATTDFIEFVNIVNDDKCLGLNEIRRIMDPDAIEIINNHCKIEHPHEIQKFEADIRNACLKDLKKLGLSIRQIERLTGIGRGIIQKI